MLIKVPQGQAIEYLGEGTLKEILVQENKELLKQYIAARTGDEHVDFHTQLTSEAEVELIPWDADEAAWIYRHSMSHVLAQAVLRLFPDAQLAIGPAIDDGFYYDFDVAEPFTPEDLRKDRARDEAGRQAKPQVRADRCDAPRSRRDGRQRSLQTGNPRRLGRRPDLVLLQDGEFVDLCRGPHMLGTGQVKHFKLLSVAGAYWRGDESRKMLQRIYGTAFATREALDHHLAMLEEAKKRDHRTLGKQLELFTFDDEVGPGLPLWLPKGAVLIDELEDLARKTEHEAGYQRVRTPHICKESIYLRSGHLPYYAESMFPPMELEGVKYYLKPMNCPHHHKIFAAASRSYRDLPLRLAEYGTCYRYEQSGELFGLMRVRSLQMNDAHIYCTLDQFEEEFLAVCQMYLRYFELFGLENYLMRLSTHAPSGLGAKYVDDSERWLRTEDMVRGAMARGGINYEEVPDEAAFYGPKIDVEVWSAIGRQFTIATNQVDFAVPGRFGLTYTNAAGEEETPICIHRAPLGTHERFIGFLIEHYAGAFPVWLAPVQAVVLPIAERHAEYGTQLHQQLLAAGIRAELDAASETLNKRIRQAQTQKVPYMLIAGDREIEEGKVAIRQRSGAQLDPLPLAEAVELISAEISS